MDCISIMCDNTNAVNKAKKLMHNNIRHHFLCDNVEKRHIEMTFCKTEDQVADIFTKALGQEHFELNRLHLGLIRGT